MDGNEKSELTNAVAAVDSDYRYAYDFDDIGNRESSSERGTNSVYAANQLNQYCSITTLTPYVGPQTSSFSPQFDDDGNQTLVTTATGIWSVTYNGEDFEAEDSSCYDVELLSYDTIESFLQDEAEAYFDKVLKEWHDANNAYQKEEETKGRHKEFERIKSEYDKKRKGK